MVCVNSPVKQQVDSEGMVALLSDNVMYMAVSTHLYGNAEVCV